MMNTSSQVSRPATNCTVRFDLVDMSGRWTTRITTLCPRCLEVHRARRAGNEVSTVMSSAKSSCTVCNG